MGEISKTKTIRMIPLLCGIASKDKSESQKIVYKVVKSLGNVKSLQPLLRNKNVVLFKTEAGLSSITVTVWINVHNRRGHNLYTTVNER